MLLVNKTLKFQMYITKKCYNFLLKNFKNVCNKSSLRLSAKNTVTVNFVDAVRLNKLSTNDFVKLYFEQQDLFTFLSDKAHP